MARHFSAGPANPRWAGDAISEQGGRQRARRMYAGEHACEIADCGARAERHHKDGNTSNNERSNIAFLCHKHHVEADGRMTRAALRSAHRAAIVGKPHTPEHCAKISAGLVGRPVSDDTRAKMSAARTAYYAMRPKPTHCPHGHPYDARNTFHRADGRYMCRECGRQRSRDHYHRTRGGA